MKHNFIILLVVSGSVLQGGAAGAAVYGVAENAGEDEEIKD